MSKRSSSEAEAEAASAAASATPTAPPAAAATAAAAAAAPATLVSGEELAAFADTLAQFTPTIPDDVIRHYMLRSGLEASDPRVVRMISLATQKFIAEVADDAMQHNKQRHAAAGRRTVKDKGAVLTVADLSAALNEQGATVTRPQYYI